MKKNSFFIFLLVSFLIHMFFFGGVTLFPAPGPKNNVITVEYVSAPKSQDTLREKINPENPLKQIVDQNDKSLNNEESKNAKYLSKNSQTVAKETVARERGEFKNSAAKNPGSMSPPQQISKQIPQQPTPAPEPKMKLQHNNQKLPFDPLAESKRAFKSKAYEQMASNQPSNSTGAGDPSRTQDYLKNTELGVETVLNTKEFKYYTYFNRIRRQLSQHWEPKVRDKLTKMFRQGRSIASDQDRITKLLIVLNPSGILVKVQVVSDSGVRDLDDAAIEAFKSAAPFPNPPQGIVDPDGTVKIRWDFILES